MSWEQWFQDVGSSVINKAAEAKFVQPYEIDKLRLQALGELGIYSEGQPQQPARGGGLFGLSEGGTLLLIGAGLVAVMMAGD